MNNYHEDQQRKFHEPRLHDDINLIEMVRNIIASNGLENELISAYDNHPFIVDANIKRPQVQQHFLNRYWQYQLMCCEEPSYEERSCLIMSDDSIAWLRVFSDHVLPFIIRNRLPLKV